MANSLQPTSLAPVNIQELSTLLNVVQQSEEATKRAREATDALYQKTVKELFAAIAEQQALAKSLYAKLALIDQQNIDIHQQQIDELLVLGDKQNSDVKAYQTVQQEIDKTEKRVITFCNGVHTHTHVTTGSCPNASNGGNTYSGTLYTSSTR